jgi:hypothetical protein
VHNIAERSHFLAIFYSIWGRFGISWNMSIFHRPGTSNYKTSGMWLYMAFSAISDHIHIISAVPPPPMLPWQEERSMPGAMMCVLPVYTFHVLFLYLRLRRRPDIPCAGLQPRPIFQVGMVPSEYRNMYCARRHRRPQSLTLRFASPILATAPATCAALELPLTPR